MRLLYVSGLPTELQAYGMELAKFIMGRVTQAAAGNPELDRLSLVSPRHRVREARPLGSPR